MFLIFNQLKRSKKSKKSIVEDSNSLKDNNKENTIVNKNESSWIKKVIQEKKSNENLKDFIPLPILKGIQFVLSEKKEEVKEENKDNENKSSNKLFDVFKGKKVKLDEKDINLPIIHKLKIILKPNQEINSARDKADNIFDVFKGKDNIKFTREEINALPFINK